MGARPKHLSDLDALSAHVRIVCRSCGFEDDWTRDEFARHLSATGGSQVWSEVTRYLRCRRFGCDSAAVEALSVLPGTRPPNLPRRIGRLDASLLDAALGVLDAAVRRSRGQAVATVEVRLALLVIHRYARDRNCVRRFWSRASAENRTADDGLRGPLQVIRQRLSDKGWIAPTVLLEDARTWPWSTPAPPGWLAAPEPRDLEDRDG